MQAVCPVCSALNPVSNAFCAACGTPLESAKVVREMTAPKQTAPQPNRAGKSRSGIWWLLLVLAALIIAPVVYQALREQRSAPAYAPDCLTDLYAREASEILSETRDLTAGILPAMEAGDLQGVEDLQVRVRLLSFRWHAMEPPGCLEAAHQEFSNAFISYDAMINAWLKGDIEAFEELLYQAVNHWQTAGGLYVEVLGTPDIEDLKR